MAESRDRLVRAVDVAELFSRRREGHLGIYRDQPELEMALSSPYPRGPIGRGSIGTSRSRGRTFESPVAGRGSLPIWMGSAVRNSGSSRRGVRVFRRGSNSVLPSNYPRTPLRDITAVVRAIERRRERLRGSEARETGSPLRHGVVVPDPSEQTPVASRNEASLMTPIPTLVGPKKCPPTVRVQRFLHEIANQPSADSENLTPQRKLLNSIDTVNKVVKEELQRLKKTPTAKKEEQERKVRTLMSFR